MRIITAPADKISQADFLRAILGPPPAPTALEREVARRLSLTVEERRRAFADRQEAAGLKRPTEDELLRLFPEPLIEVEHLAPGRIAA
jgi:hypothetical protein